MRADAAAMSGARELNAGDIMTADLVSVAPDARAADVAQIVVWRRISPVPVVEGGRLVGMVSEADLLRVLASGIERDPAHRPWWMRLLGGASTPMALAKFRTLRAADIMAAPATFFSTDTPLAKVAEAFERPGVKRVPVLRGGRLAGIVTRAGLARALSACGAASSGERMATEGAMRIRAIRNHRLAAWEFPSME